MEEIDVYYRQLWERAEPLAQRLLPAVRPLFRDHPNDRPEHIGTCVLLRVGSERLLLTAAHVIDEFLGADMLILGKDRLEGIRGRGVRLDGAPGKPREDDVIDVGVLRIDSDLPLSVDENFLSPAAIGIEESVIESALYLALGYPLTKTKLNPVARQVKSLPVKYVGRRAPNSVYNQVGLHPSTHVLIEFDQKRSVTETGIRPVMKPTGMSGGGLWWWRNPADQYALPQARLTAILIEHRRENKLIVATRVRYHIATIRREWPDLREHLIGFPLP